MSSEASFSTSRSIPPRSIPNGSPWPRSRAGNSSPCRGGGRFSGYWCKDDPDARLIEAVEGQALPTLRPVRTLADFIDFASIPRRWGGPIQSDMEENFILDVAMGRLDEA